jgi:hypothetical protein
MHKSQQFWPLYGFNGRFVRKKDFQYSQGSMSLKLLDLIRSLPHDTDTVPGKRNLLIVYVSTWRMSYSPTNLPCKPSGVAQVIVLNDF